MAGWGSVKIPRDLESSVNALKTEVERFVQSIESAVVSNAADGSSAIDEKARDLLGYAKTFIEWLNGETVRAASVSAEETAARVEAAVNEGTERVEDAIRNRPLTAVVLAFGVGCALTLLARRR